MPKLLKAKAKALLKLLLKKSSYSDTKRLRWNNLILDVYEHKYRLYKQSIAEFGKEAESFDTFFRNQVEGALVESKIFLDDFTKQQEHELFTENQKLIQEEKQI